MRVLRAMRVLVPAAAAAPGAPGLAPAASATSVAWAVDARLRAHATRVCAAAVALGGLVTDDAALVIKVWQL